MNQQLDLHNMCLAQKKPNSEGLNTKDFSFTSLHLTVRAVVKLRWKQEKTTMQSNIDGYHIGQREKEDKE